MSETPMTSYVYKHAAGTDISVDVYLPKTASTKPLKVLLWFHGGGLLMSHRGNIAPHLKRSAERHSLCFVSADYRLAPQASLPDILEDVRDCAAWCRKDLKQIVAAQGFLLDDTLVIGGASAGGYLSLLSGLPISGVTPPPAAVLALYPITNPLGPFFTTPQRPVSYVGDGRVIPHSEMADHIDPAAQTIPGWASATSPPQHGDRTFLYTYMIQEANLAKLLFANAPEADPQHFAIAEQMFKEFPPTYMFHGEIDDKVGIEQARAVAEAMKGCGATLVYDEVLGPDLSQHGFDYEPEVELERMYDFMQSTTQSSKM